MRARSRGEPGTRAVSTGHSELIDLRPRWPRSRHESLIDPWSWLSKQREIGSSALRADVTPRWHGLGVQERLRHRLSGSPSLPSQRTQAALQVLDTCECCDLVENEA